MSKTVDIERIELAIKDLESRIRNLKFALDHNENETQELAALKIVLKENIIELKRDHIIAVAHEFKRSKDDLVKTSIRLNYLMLDKRMYRKAFEGQEATLVLLKRKLAEAVEKTKNNVIYIKFGSKSGR